MSKPQSSRDPAPRAYRGAAALASLIGSAIAAALTVFIVGATLIKGNAAAEKPSPLLLVFPWALPITSGDLAPSNLASR